MANNENVMDMLRDASAILVGSHIVYTSGRHGSTYVNKDALYLHTKPTSELCKFMAQMYPAGSIDVVVGPTVGGVVLSQWVAHHMNEMRTSGETLAVYAEKDGEGEDKKIEIKRGYDKVIPGKNILVVEDILTTGGSARKVVEVVKALGGNVVAVCAICNRGNVSERDVGDVKLDALTTVNFESHLEEECPMCRDNMPINTNVGKGKAFLERRGVAV